MSEFMHYFPGGLLVAMYTGLALVIIVPAVLSEAGRWVLMLLVGTFASVAALGALITLAWMWLK